MYLLYRPLVPTSSLFSNCPPATVDTQVFKEIYGLKNNRQCKSSRIVNVFTFYQNLKLYTQYIFVLMMSSVTSCAKDLYYVVVCFRLYNRHCQRSFVMPNIFQKSKLAKF